MKITEIDTVAQLNKALSLTDRPVVVYFTAVW